MADTTTPPELVVVTNFWPASGGADRETLEDAQAQARKTIKTPFQAVTSNDYETLAKDTPGLRVARVQAIPRKAPKIDNVAELEESEASVTVIVVPFSFSTRPTPSAGFRKTVHHHLERHRLITTQVHVIGPWYVGISIEGEVYLRARASKTGTRQLMEEALHGFFHPLEGGPDGKGWPFGRMVYPSEIYQTIENVDGVDFLENIRLSSPCIETCDDGEIPIPPNSLVYWADLSGLQVFPADSTRLAKGGSDDLHRRIN